MFQHHARFFREALRRRSSLRGFLLAVTPVEAIYAAGRVDQLLLAGKERMAGRANFNVQIAFARRARFESLATGAGYRYFFIFRVNSRFHFFAHLYGCRLVASIKQAMIRVATALRQASARPQMRFFIRRSLVGLHTQTLNNK